MDNYTTLKEKEILKLHYGWDHNKRMTFEELSEVYGDLRERIRRTEDKALWKIRHSKWGRLKAIEMYRQEKEKLNYDSNDFLQSIYIDDRYLIDEVM